MFERTFTLRSTQGLRFDVTTDPEDPVLLQFYEGYDRAFVLANEKESLEGFQQCLELNHGTSHAKLLASYGPFREVVLLATDDELDEVVGGANFITCPIETGNEVRLCTNLNYIYTDPTHRRRGNLRRLTHGLSEVNQALFPAAAGARSVPVRRALVFLEQNDPLRLSPEQYAHDTQYSGIDQVDRIGIWAKLGARILDFPYAQPPLSPDQEADHTLLYAVLGADDSTLDPELVRRHLARFFGISVLKGRSLHTDPTATRQLELLRELAIRGARVPLLDPTGWLSGMAPPGSPNRLDAYAIHENLLDVLRSGPERGAGRSLPDTH